MPRPKHRCPKCDYQTSIIRTETYPNVTKRARLCPSCFHAFFTRQKPGELESIIIKPSAPAAH